MDMNILYTVIALTAVGLGCGIAIYIVNKKLPEESEVMKRTGAIAEVLPGMNCGACGKPGCFAYAQALAEDTDVIQTTPCMTALNDEDCVAGLEEVLGVKLDAAGMDMKAVVHCTGFSEHLFEYDGIDSCKGAAQLAAGYKKCPFGCLGLGDCMKVCPYDAYRIDKEKGVAIVDWNKCIGCGLCVAECPHGLIELVPGATGQYLGCSYPVLLPIPGRERCKEACIKCRKCTRANPDHVTWNNEKMLPSFDGTFVPEAIEECPPKVIIKTR